MPITTLDSTSALVVIDLQKGVVGMPVAHPIDGVVEQAVALAEAFRRHDLPVVLVNVAGRPGGRTDENGGATPASFPEGWTDLIPELDQQPTDLLVTKHAKSAFTGTGLADALRSRGVTQVVVVGVATGSGVESTARDAHEQGFHVTVPVDAMTDTRIDSHDHSVSTVFPRIAETGTTRDVLDALAATRS